MPVKQGVLEKAEDSRTRSSQSHLSLVGVRSGTDNDGHEYVRHVGYPLLTTSQLLREVLLVFLPLVCSGGKKTFCKFLHSLTYLQRNSGAISIFHGNKTGRL